MVEPFHSAEGAEAFAVVVCQIRHAEWVNDVFNSMAVGVDLAEPTFAVCMHTWNSRGISAVWHSIEGSIL